MSSLLSTGLVIGISIGITIGLVIGGSILICYYRSQKKPEQQIQEPHSDWQGMELPIRVNGLDASSVLSDVTIGTDSPPRGKTKNSTFKSWFANGEKNSNAILSHSGLPSFPYK
jgi:hypothetical protein